MDALSQTFAALAHPTRRAILTQLGHGQAPVQALIDELDIRGPAMTKHLIVLERSGLIRRSREAQTRPCHLEAKAIEAALTWMEELRAQTEAQFDRMEAYLRSLDQKKAKPARKPRQKPRRKSR